MNNWLGVTYTIKEVGWKIVGKSILVTAISFFVVLGLGFTDMNLTYQLLGGILVVLGISALWFFLTKILPEQ